MISQKTSDEIDIDEYRRKIDAMEDQLAAAQNKLDGKTPIRKPYGNDIASSGSGSKPAGSGTKSMGSGTKSMGSDSKSMGSGTKTFQSDFNTALKSSGNSIDAKLNAAKEKAGTFGGNSFPEAQKKFNSTVADVKAPTGRGDFRDPADIMSAKPSNDFKQALADTQSKIQSGIGAVKDNGFKNPLAKVNQSLYDMNGQLTTGDGKPAKSIVNTVGNSVDAARERFSSALGTFSGKTAEAVENTQQFGGQFKDKIVQAAAELTPPLRGGGDNAFKPAFIPAADPVKAEAQTLLNKAKERVAGLGTGFDYPSANKQPPKFGAPAPSTDNQFNRTRVANVTPVTTPSPNVQRNGLESNLTKAWNNGLKQSQLAPIEVGTPTQAPGNGLRTASAQSSTFGSATSASTIPAAFDRNRNAMMSHVSDIDIPSKILSGSSNYAPGSVNQVR